MDEVSTGSGSDRVRVLASSILLSPETRSLPLPVLTLLPASQIRALPRL